MGEPDEVDGPEERPTGASGLTLLGLLGGAIVAAVLLGQLTNPDPSPPTRVAVAATTPSHLATGPAPDKPIGVESLKRCPVPMGGVTLGDQMQVRGSTVERITVVNGKPHVSPLDGFVAAAVTTLRPPVVHEISYQTADLGLDERLGSGEVWAAVMTGAGFEAGAFEDSERPAGFVRGKPAIYSADPYPPRYAFSTGETSGALAWESAPGELTSIGFSGSASRTKAIEILRALTDSGKVLTPAQWLNRDRSSVG